MKTVDIVVRQQHAKVGRAGYGGHNCYIVAVIRDVDSEPVGDHPLTEHNIKRYGWQVEHCGEAYKRQRGPRSKFQKALRQAEAIRELITGETK